MRLHVKCEACGATWWCHGEYELEVNTLVFTDSELQEGQCSCGEEVEILESEYEQEE